MIEQLPLDKCELASPEDANRRGPYACIAAPTQQGTVALHQKLLASAINVSLRSGALRVAPHLYNTEEDIQRLLTCLSQ